MKRIGGIFGKICDRETLAAAFQRVVKGKRWRRDVVAFAADLEENLNTIRRELEDGSFKFGGYKYFKIKDPKPRTIAAAPVRERVVHHALIAVVGDRLERALIDKSYACRRGKGQWAAVAEAKRLAGMHKWCLKLDIRHFFDTIDHGTLMKMLSRKIKDRRVMEIIGRLVESYSTELEKGVPIGNLTSQYFANLYLDVFDRWLARPGVDHVRYMDDIIVFGERERLRAIMREVPTFLGERLRLELKPKGGLHRTSRGVDFLGTRVFPGSVNLNRRSKLRFRRRLAELDALLAEGMISEKCYQKRATQLFAFARNCDSAAFRRKVISEDGQKVAGAAGARRMLVQQLQQQRRRRGGMPLGVSQQQLQQQHEPEQCKQLLGASRCLLHRSSTDNEARLNRQFSGTAFMGGQTKKMPFGVGRRQADGHAGRLWSWTKMNLARRVT